MPSSIKNKKVKYFLHFEFLAKYGSNVIIIAGNWFHWFLLLEIKKYLTPRLHGHAIFGGVSVSDTCRTPERVRRAGFRCPAVSLFFFFFRFSDTASTRLRHGSDAAQTRRRRGSDASDMPAVKKKKKKRKNTDFDRWTYLFRWFRDNPKTLRQV